MGEVRFVLSISIIAGTHTFTLCRLKKCLENKSIPPIVETEIRKLSKGRTEN